MNTKTNSLPRMSIAMLVLLLGIIACDSSTDPVTTPGPETDGRITINNDEDALGDRVTDRDVDILLDTTGLGKRSGPLAFSLTLKYDIATPTVGGQAVQATSVNMSGSYAHVSYNMSGSAYTGAVDVIWLLFGGAWGAFPVSNATFEGTDVSDIYWDNNYVFLAEATNDTLFDPLTAVVERIATAGFHKLTVTDALRSPLQSFVTTSVAADNNNVYVTTGNTGYLYRLDQATLTVQDSVSLDDARWVDVDANNVVVLQGTPGRISVYNKTNLALAATYSVGGATIAESKSTVQLIGGKALIAAGDSGVKLVNLATGTEVGSLPRVTVTGLDPLVTVTNSVSASGKYVFMGNGEAGVYVAEASQDLSNNSGDTPITLTNLGKLQFSNLQSVNHVSYNGSHLIIASGIGGVKIVKVTF